MEVTFAHKLGDMVLIVDAKMDARVVSAGIDIDGTKSYGVMFWHEGNRVVFTVGEWELQ